MADVGRPFEWMPTDQDIQDIKTMRARGATKEEIADFYGISHDTLQRREQTISELSVALKKGFAEGKIFVQGKLFEQINAGNVPSIFFWLKHNCNWKDRVLVETQRQPDPENDTTKERLTDLLSKPMKE